MEEFMNYVVDYAPVGDSVVYAWEEGMDPRRLVLKSGKAKSGRGGIFGAASARPKKSKAIIEAAEMPTAVFLAQLTDCDSIFTELGGQNDKFCIAAFRRETKILRLPTFFIHDEQKRQRIEEGKVGDQVEESASTIYRYALISPEIFYPFREVDLPYLEVRLLARMYWTVQRKIRIAIANRIRHIQEDLEFLGGPFGFPITKQAIESVLITLPAEEQIEVDSKEIVAIKFFKSLERLFKRELEKKLEPMPLYQTVFAPLKGCGVGITGFVIASIMDIRRFPTLPKLRAYAGYHLLKRDGGWEAPRLRKGERANWNRILQQAIYYFTLVIDKQKPDNLWKVKLEKRYHYEIGKLLDKAREAGKEISSEMTADSFLAMVQKEREKAAKDKKIPVLPESYKGIPALARKRARRWLGQKFLQYIWTEWRRFEGIRESSSVVSA